MMMKAIALAAIIAVLLTFPAPILAQEGMSGTDGQSSSALAENAPIPSDFALEEDGELVVGGDVVIDCPSLARHLEQYGEPSRVAGIRYELNVQNEQTRRSSSRCEQRAFSAFSDESPALSGENGDTALPDSSGVSPFLLVVVLLFVGVGLIVYRKARSLAND